MHLHALRWKWSLLAVAVVGLMPRVAAAVDAEFTAGGGLAVPSVPAFEVAGSVGGSGGPVTFTAQLRGASLVVGGGFSPGIVVALTAGARFGFARHFFARTLAGAGVSTACIQGDFCGGVGPAVTLELGASLFDGPLHLVVVSRAAALFGLANGVFVLPAFTLNAGFSF